MYILNYTYNCVILKMYVLTLLDTIFKEKATPIESHCQELDHISVSTSTQNDLKFVQTPVSAPIFIMNFLISFQLLFYHNNLTDFKFDPFSHLLYQKYLYVNNLTYFLDSPRISR